MVPRVVSSLGGCVLLFVYLCLFKLVHLCFLLRWFGFFVTLLFLYALVSSSTVLKNRHNHDAMALMITLWNRNKNGLMISRHYAGKNWKYFFFLFYKIYLECIIVYYALERILLEIWMLILSLFFSFTEQHYSQNFVYLKTGRYN